jgi:ATP-dependent Clp protease ATP-binding subunit ClpX
VLLDVMFEIPSRGDVKKVIIDGETIARRKPAQLITRSEARAVELEDESA